HPTLDGIAHCAAVYTREREETPEGFERMFATNHLGPFLLTGLLDAPLKASGGARVVLASAPSTSELDFDDLQARREFHSLHAFGASKMANLLFAYALASRYEGSGCTSNAFFPGLMRSGLMRSASAPIRVLTGLASRSADPAGIALATLLSAPGFAGANGRFFKLDRPTESNAYSHDVRHQQKLWAESERLLGFAPG
ncbi:MAG: SDR family NAD(P)-dependent oxidoreductase, partial [Thermoplasmata archaeon]|nr:SDR family NAD(P)-dependent oxidoreductase [Thermoplasmata archaeon]